MTLSFLWSAVTDPAKKIMRAWRFVVAVVLLSLVIVAGCDVRPFSEFSGDDNGSEESSEEDDEMPNDPDLLELRPTPTAIETSVNREQTINIEVVEPEAGRTYMFRITTSPTNGEADINNNLNNATGVLNYMSDTATDNDRLVVTVTDDGTPRRSGTIEIDITVTQN